MSNNVSGKKKLRKQFRNAVFKRDGNKCIICLAPGVDAHHITDRNEMPNGGYALSNGITLCSKCHIKAEQFHISEGKKWEENFHPNDLYKLIGFSYEKAKTDSFNLL